ncbi:hypothetical protein GCM10007276_12070 [Agaricicola taiwanensis]|uniref:Uncharacterized protein n=1 Tax=Agaricicola taiwanensis TaxID=591372 RepID=A0A8J2VQZ2_9RHOB|nr:hypothetical protein [Agaricicola taiwanensis]GGE36186.1 hypothetical protein GCM10007276_12070 [Agaricicola taiwanensis]
MTGYDLLWYGLAAWFIISLCTWSFIRGATAKPKPRTRVSCKVRGEELITNEYLEAALRGDA